MLAFHGCNIPDDIIAIHKELDALGEEDKEIATRIKVVRESINALQAIVDVLQSGYYIKSVTSFVDEDGRTGNICSFTNGQEIRIYDGRNAEDGSVPQIGVARNGMDDVYYWTVDGGFVYDDKGNLVPVAPSEGGQVTSQDDMVPQLQIKDGYWFVSFDYGTTWIHVGKATGKDGLDGEDGIDHIISLDTSSEDFVRFVLMDGTSISIPYHKEIRIHFNMDDEEIPIAGRETIKIEYSLTSADSGTYVSVSTDGFYTALSKQTSDLEGYILVTCPRAYSDGFINVMVYTATGVSDMKVIRFTEKKMTLLDGDVYNVPVEGATISVPFKANFEYRLVVDENSRGWLEAVQTRSAQEYSGEIDINVGENTGIARSGIVYIYSENGVDPYASIVINQESAYCKAENGSYDVSYEGGTILSNITTTYGVSLVMPEADWVRGEVIKKGDNEYVLAFTVDPNASEEPRSALVEVNSGSGKIPLTTIALHQRGRNLDLEMGMIFIVRPNYSNDFTVYLPIDVRDDIGIGRYPLDCFIDWGDGTKGEHVSYSDGRWSLPQEERVVSHHYEGLEEGRLFEVVVTGTVSSLNADAIPRGFRSSVTEVKQWGRLGLKSMERAFEAFTGLETLHPDETGAFSEVSSFVGAFRDCPRLKTVSEHLFDYASEAVTFSGVFRNCESLVTIPEKLFSKCRSAEDFSIAFYECRSLSSIPDDLLSNCNNVKTVSFMFGRTSIQSIPERLFSRCPEIEDFSSIFYECRNVRSIPESLFANNRKAKNMEGVFENTAIRYIPEHLFDNCPRVERFSNTFNDCGLLEKIPQRLFDNQRSVVDFTRTFGGCGSIWSESPYTIIGGKKVHIYERKNHPDHFVTPVYNEGCFSCCWQMTDIEDVPAEWK